MRFQDATLADFEQAIASNNFHTELIAEIAKHVWRFEGSPDELFEFWTRNAQGYTFPGDKSLLRRLATEVGISPDVQMMDDFTVAGRKSSSS